MTDISEKWEKRKHYCKLLCFQTFRCKWKLIRYRFHSDRCSCVQGGLLSILAYIGQWIDSYMLTNQVCIDWVISDNERLRHIHINTHRLPLSVRMFSGWLQSHLFFFFFFYKVIKFLHSVSVHCIMATTLKNECGLPSACVCVGWWESFSETEYNPGQSSRLNHSWKSDRKCRKQNVKCLLILCLLHPFPRLQCLLPSPSVQTSPHFFLCFYSSAGSYFLRRYLSGSCEALFLFCLYVFICNFRSVSLLWDFGWVLCMK